MQRRPIGPSPTRAAPAPVHVSARGRGAANGIKTAVLLGALGGLLVWVGSMLFTGPVGATLGLVLGAGVVGGSYWYSDRLALRAARARPVTPAEAPAYHRVVEDLAARAGLPKPRVYVSPSPQPNAFATGRDPGNAAVCVTEGLLKVLDADEVRAVLAHELAHVGNRDILLTSVAAAIATGISWLANVLLWLPLFGATDDEGHANPLGLLVAALLAPLAATLLQLALSRNREFEADRVGAELLGEGHTLARALQKIETVARRVPVNVDPAQSSAYIVNPLTGRRMTFAQLFATHPPTEQRIARLVSGGAWHPRHPAM
jgi:heat shock protein HtpX